MNASAQHTPGPAAEAIANAEAHLSDAGLRGYMDLAESHAELLEALQSAEQALNKIRVCCHHTAWDATGPAVIAARAAIAKAAGAAA